MPPDIGLDKLVAEAFAVHLPLVVDCAIDVGAGGFDAIRDEILNHSCIVTQNYRDAIDHNGEARSELEMVTIVDYLSNDAAIYPRSMISEEEPPQGLVDRLRLPNCLNPKRHSRLFVGRRGCVSDLHCDWLSYWICHVPVFGEKHFMLFPPQAGRRFAPQGNLSKLKIRDFSTAERSSLLNECGGLEFALRRGQLLLMPPFWWHHVTYRTDAGAISIGVGPVDGYVRSFIADRDMPRVSILARVYDEMIRSAPLNSAQRGLFDVVRKEWTAKPMRHSIAIKALAEARASLSATRM